MTDDKMKKLIFLLAIIPCSLLSCSENEIKTYDGRDFIYFGSQADPYDGAAIWDSLTTFNFMFYPGVNDTLISLKVSAGGMIPGHDRKFLIESQVEGDAVEGLDFELPQEQVIPAGKNSAYIRVNLLRRAEMEGKAFTVRVSLKPNENFTTNLPWVINRNADTISRQRMAVKCMNELAAPTLFVERDFIHGYWSIAKFNAMNELWGTTLEDWLDLDPDPYINSKVELNYNNYMIVFANHLNRKIAEGDDAAIKDPAAESTRGYMSIPGFGYYGISPTVVPGYFPTTPEWEGEED